MNTYIHLTHHIMDMDMDTTTTNTTASGDGTIGNNTITTITTTIASNATSSTGTTSSIGIKELAVPPGVYRRRDDCLACMIRGQEAKTTVDEATRRLCSRYYELNKLGKLDTTVPLLQLVPSDKTKLVLQVAAFKYNKETKQATPDGATLTIGSRMSLDYSKGELIKHFVEVVESSTVTSTNGNGDSKVTFRGEHCTHVEDVCKLIVQVAINRMVGFEWKKLFFTVDLFDHFIDELLCSHFDDCETQPGNPGALSVEEVAKIRKAKVEGIKLSFDDDSSVEVIPETPPRKPKKLAL